MPASSSDPESFISFAVFKRVISLSECGWTRPQFGQAILLDVMFSPTLYEHWHGHDILNRSHI